ncbi:PTS lactose/cellobiose transporter subunit IIA [Listeria ilorinensis]|uniref:PTS lactose/cellobiose transporter subunit IIA n=1 Tax=Listeria ilorinensis TaxID=2867439 RepID=UPI001EF491D9|nr:PTS lactose/cellobiose transporter subunit IIA [Listeria ilorinensis]
MKTEQAAFSLISLAGDSFSQLVEALHLAKQGEHEEMERKLQAADSLMNEAHRVQTELMVEETRGEATEFSVLLVHAQDTLMNTILASTLIREMIDMYEELKQAK